jgi:hypothetical protein
MFAFFYFTVRRPCLSHERGKGERRAGVFSIYYSGLMVDGMMV